MAMHYNKSMMAKQCTTFAGHFDGHGDALVQQGVHRPKKQVHCYTRCHWTLSLGKYLPRIALTDTIVINFGKNLVVALWNQYFEASVQMAQNGPSNSTQLIKVTSCVERSNTTIKAEEPSYLSSYQMQTTDKLVKSLITKETCKKVGAHERP